MSAVRTIARGVAKRRMKASGVRRFCKERSKPLSPVLMRLAGRKKRKVHRSYFGDHWREALKHGSKKRRTA